MTSPGLAGAVSFSVSVPPPSNSPAGHGHLAVHHPRLVRLAGRRLGDAGVERRAACGIRDHRAEVAEADRMAALQVAGERVEVAAKRHVPDQEADHRGGQHRHPDHRQSRPPSGPWRPFRSGSPARRGPLRRRDHRLDGRQHPLTQIGRWGQRRHGVGQRGRDRLGLAQLPAAAFALGGVQRDALGVLLREGVQRLAGDQLVDVFHSSSGCMPAAASVSRSARMAANVRLLTVPMGSASRAASSDCVYPAK